MNDKNIEDIYELSPMQQGMLFHTLYDANTHSNAYFEQLVLTLQGTLQPAAWQWAWQQVTERHTALRCAFHWQELDEPLQIVSRQVTLPWVLLDWRSETTEAQQNKLDALLKADQAQGFVLEEAPLMRFTLIQLDEHRWQLLWSHHHLLFDGWSMPIILDEVMALYQAYQQQQAPSLAPVRPYRDFIQWWQALDKAAAKQFWIQRLHDFTAPTPLPLPKPARVLDTDRAEISVQLSVEDTDQLQHLAKQHHLTLNNLVQGAWALLLSRYSGESDVVFGVTISGRPTEINGIAQMVGLFINTLPLRTQRYGQQSLIPWLQTLQNQYVEQEQYQYYSLADIQACSNVPGGTALFDSILVFESYPFQTDKPKQELEITDLRSLEQTNYPLTLIANPERQLKLRIKYDTTRFTVDSVERMLGHLQQLLSAMYTQPDACLQDLPMLTEAEIQQLQTWNQTATDYPKEQTIVSLFEQQVATTPDKPAVVFEEEMLTYAQLNAKANQLAHYLLAQPALKDQSNPLIAICVERSLEMIIALLGILKAGGAYLPIDSGYPPERIAYMLEDSAAPMVLTQSQFQAELPAEITTINLTSIQDISSSPEDRSGFCGPYDLAYVGYTSGSTGRPKGVCISHRAVVRLVKQTNYMEFSDQHTFLQLAPLAFDASTLEIWGSLLNGSKLVIMPQAQTTLSDMARIIQAHQVTTLWLTAGLFHLMVDEQLESLRCIKQLLAGGDILSVEHIRKVQQYLPECRLINGYGPTENTTFTACCQLNDTEFTDTAPIGKPITNTRIYVLDDQYQLVPVNVAGELCAAGDGLARGYLNRPELTAEKFIEVELFGKRERIYKTGDLVRWRPDGNLEFLGRIDNQIKLRGFRIELGEIEATLLQHEAVKEAVVVLYERDGNKSLAAYVTTDSRDDLHLRDYLQIHLPDYMIPAHIVATEHFPLTPNGKIDRQALTKQAAEQNFTLDTPDFIAPRNAEETQLAEIWVTVLGLERIGIYDNFFHMGGHSLTAMQVVSRAQDIFTVDIEIRNLFENPCIAEFASYIQQQMLSQTDGSLLEELLAEVE